MASIRAREKVECSFSLIGALYAEEVLKKAIAAINSQGHLCVPLWEYVKSLIQNNNMDDDISSYGRARLLVSNVAGVYNLLDENSHNNNFDKCLGNLAEQLRIICMGYHPNGSFFRKEILDMTAPANAFVCGAKTNLFFPAISRGGSLSVVGRSFDESLFVGGLSNTRRYKKVLLLQIYINVLGNFNFIYKILLFS